MSRRKTERKETNKEFHHNNKYNKSYGGFCAAQAKVFDVPECITSTFTIAPSQPITYHCVPFFRTYFVSVAFPFSRYFFFLLIKFEQCFVHSPKRVNEFDLFAQNGHEQRMNGYFRMECRCEIKFERPFSLRAVTEEILWARRKSSIFALKSILFISLHPRNWLTCTQVSRRSSELNSVSPFDGQSSSTLSQNTKLNSFRSNRL